MAHTTSVKAAAAPTRAHPAATAVKTAVKTAAAQSHARTRAKGLLLGAAALPPTHTTSPAVLHNVPVTICSCRCRCLAPFQPRCLQQHLWRLQRRLELCSPAPRAPASSRQRCCCRLNSTSTCTCISTMPPSKRSRRSFAPDADSLLAIRLAEEEDGAPPLAADRHLLQVASECASGLPSDATTWDLSGLLVDGQPVRREVVLAWLHAVTQNTFKQPFSEPQEYPLLATSATRLAQLLSFADAVGSVDSVLEACLPQPLEQLRFCVAAGGEQEMKLEVGGVFWWGDDEPMKLARTAPDQKTDMTVASLPSKEAKAALGQQFASQLEALLYLAHRLELDSLVALLHRCLRYNTAFNDSLLDHPDSVIDPRVMSARVLEAAVGPQAGQQAQAAFVNSITTERCGFVDYFGLRQVFKPLNLTVQQQQPIRFQAQVTEDFLGVARKGQRVDVELDLFVESEIRVGAYRRSVHLCVGDSVAKRHLTALHAAHEDLAVGK